MKSRRIALLASCVALAVSQSFSLANLIQNGNFAEWTDNKPAGWAVVATEQKIAKDTPDEKPALKVEIAKEAGGNLGEIRQTIKVKPNSKYRFTADLRSTKAGQALFMLKPKTKTKELARIATETSTDQWKTVTKDVETGEAGELQVLCRYVQKADSVGGSSWFTNLKLVRLDENGNPVEEAAEPIAKPAAAAKKAPTAPVVAAAGIDQYITPDGAGDKSGKDWASARAASSIQAAIDAAGPGNTVFIGSGTYDNLALTVGAGGSGPSATKTISGKDTGGGLPVFKSNFTRENPAKSGKTLFSINPGVGHVVIRDLKTIGHKTAVVAKGPNVGLQIQNVDVDESRDAFVIQGNATAEDANSGTRDLVIKDCDVKLFTKRAVRLFDGVSNAQIINCHADAGGKDWSVEPFPICFQVIGGDNGVIDRDITFTDCTATGAYHNAGPDKYWNADGFCTERAVKNVTWIRCGAFDNTDGGWDLKNANIKLVDCIGVGNKRNFRVWTLPGEDKTTMENCLSAYSTDRGNRGHDVGFWFLVGGEAVMKNCTAWGDRVSVSVEGKEGKPDKAIMTLDHCLISPAKGGSTKMTSGTELKNIDSVIVADDAASPELKAPRQGWRGGDDAFDSKVTGLGYKNPAK